MLKNQRKDTYNRADTVYKKQARLKTPSLRFPLSAGGTEGRGSPREAGGTCRRGAIVNSDRAIDIKLPRGGEWKPQGAFFLKRQLQHRRRL